eukprot:TRINITY_DN6327_c0_g1_i2.p1 TRINITY_DN6327_c0_g1~~TRINITY_DN6327_c0_g1_i2.p1  ORF type:complete len:104 (+),score=36.29 TRINITY_DN6327_c0_g1_i2:84-395(+)
MSFDHDLDERVFLAFLKQLSALVFSSGWAASSQAAQSLASSYFGVESAGLEIVSSYSDLLIELVKKDSSTEECTRKLDSLNIKKPHAEAFLFFWNTEKSTVNF